MTNCYFIPLFDTNFKLPTSAKECDPSYIKLFIQGYYVQSIVKTGSYSLVMKLKMQKVSRWTDAGHTLIRKVHFSIGSG